jgi:hypothetical protein
MKTTAIATLFTLVLGAVAMPENFAGRDAAGLEASTYTLGRTQPSDDVRLWG